MIARPREKQWKQMTYVRLLETYAANNHCQSPPCINTAILELTLAILFDLFYEILW
jgi:hypothetical protein